MEIHKLKLYLKSLSWFGLELQSNCSYSQLFAGLILISIMGLCGEDLRGIERRQRAGKEKGMKETLKDETNVMSLCRSRHIKLAFVYIAMWGFHLL